MPFCQSSVKCPRPLPTGYPQLPKHIGEHIRKRRLDLRLWQREVAEQMGVSVFTVINWELGETSPPVRYGPRIIRFLGYDPSPEPRSFEEEVMSLRWRLGLTQRELAEQLEVDESTIRGWEHGTQRPTGDFRDRVQVLLNSILG